MSVLIDTWWNVNVVPGSLYNKSYDRFNRYMVECEYYQGRLDELNAGVLIDTWWNVNIWLFAVLIILSTVLIDTWWNVNFFNII